MEIVNEPLGIVRPYVEKDNWSIDKKYKFLTIVYDASSNKSYIASQEVPKGIVIDNRNYWNPFGVGKFIDNAIININYLDGVSSELVTYTLSEAIVRIANEDKRLGVILAFYGNEGNDTHTPGWCLYQFTSSDLNDWNNENAWTSIYYNRHKFIGWFYSEEELVNYCRRPYKGDYGYVGTSLTESVVYRCYDSGVWSNTQERIQGNLTVEIKGNITISDNGTWVVDGVDTGIDAQGPAGITPRFRANSGTQAIEVSYDNGITYSQLLLYSEIRANFAFRTPLQLPSGSQPTITNIGTEKDPILVFGIPAANVNSELDAALVVQSTGTSETNVMSQKAVTDALALKLNFSYI